ncbi:WD40-repeat-containing domain protein [Blakeslea trispora]|nr:WD40-repeat-containing domain protein [Blakeslea trispora]
MSTHNDNNDQASQDKLPVKEFLSRHVINQVSNSRRLCYRHRPDLIKKRRPDDLNMESAQRQMEELPTEDKAAITHIWSLFSAAPADQRILILRGLLSTCCMPQLSFLYDAIRPLLRIDFISILPREIALQIFFYLDAKSLCHAAQVSHAWKSLADDDALWHRMCEQHIDKKCTKCGWGLPLLNKKRKIPQQITVESAPLRIAFVRRPWKDVYSERLMVERNWRNNRYQLKVLSGHTDGVMCVQFCDASNVLMTGSYDKSVRIWNLETGELIRTLNGHTRCVRALQFDEAKLVTGSMDHTLKIWNWQTGQCIRTLEGHTGGVLSLHFNSRLMASGSTDHTIRVWNFSAGECCTLTGHTEWVNSVRFCQEGTVLISSSDDSTIRIWDVQKRSCIRSLGDHVGQVQLAIPSPKGFKHRLTEEEQPQPSKKQTNLSENPIVVSGSLDNTIKIWDMRTGACIRTLFGHVEGVWSLAYDTLRIASGSHDKTVRVWDLGSGRCMHALEGHNGPVTAVALSDTKIVSTSDDGDIRIWDFGVH